jgi:hypothetical protein
VSWNQPEELTEQMRLSDRSHKFRGEFRSADAADRREEDQDGILMIGGIGIFLPFAQEEAENCIADAATAEEQSQLMMTVEEEELEQTGADCPSRRKKREGAF